MKNKYFYYALSVGLVILGLEIIARAAVFFWPIEVNQRYLVSKKQGKITHMYNGRGARGSLHRGTPIKIAVFGSSVAQSYYVSQEDTWVEVMGRELGRDVHVDNFAISTMSHIAVELMESLIDRGYRYDILLLSLTFNHAYKPPWYSYSGRMVVTEPSSLQIWKHLKRWLSERGSLEQQSWSVFALYKLLKVGDRPPQDNVSKNKYIDLPATWANGVLVRDQFYGKELAKIAKRAKQLALKVIWSPEAAGYHEHMLDSYKNRSPFTVDYEKRIYLNDRGSYEHAELRRKITHKHISKLNIPVINWIDYIREKLPYEPGLYHDQLHLTPKGCRIVGKYMAEKLEPYVAEIKIRNK